MKRLIPIVLALALLCQWPAASAREDRRYGVLDDLAYYIEDGQVTIYDGKQSGSAVDGLREIPAQIEGYPVTHVALRAIPWARKLLIPPTVTRIDYKYSDLISCDLLLYYPGSYAERWCRTVSIPSQNIYTYRGVPFDDVPENVWYYESVCFVFNETLMNGVGARTFLPNAAATRAMLVTVLWRMAGAPGPEKACPFDDVPAGSWYEPAVCWASGAGVSNGVSETAFAPDLPVTREQIAALLLRFARTQGIPAAGRAEIALYPDADAVSDWAVEAMQWAREAGIVKGKLRGGDVYLDPQANARRCEIAEMLMRFCLSAD